MKKFYLHLTERLSDPQNHNLLGMFFSLILIVLLIRMPEPRIFSGQLWRVEFLTSLLLLGSIIFLLLKNRIKLDLLNISNQNLKRIIYVWAAFIAVSGISIFWANSSRAVIQHSLTWAIYLVALIGCLSAIKTAKNYKFVLSIFIITTVILGLLCVIDFSTADFATSEGTLRIRYAKYAELLVAIAPLLWVLAVYKQKREQSMFFLLIGSIVWATIMFSLSKGAFISGVSGFVFCFSTVLVFSKPIFRKKVICLAIFWIVQTVSVQASFSYLSNIPSTANYITGSADKTRASTDFRTFTWKVSGQMIADNLWIGVGANNFGIEFNNSRINYAKNYPFDKDNVVAEDHLVERAHNEFIQILAELGIVGFSVFLALFALFGFWIIRSVRRNKYRASPILCAALAGVLAFLVSSLFSSFSFRLMQNGIVFFMVVAIVVYELIKIDKRNGDDQITEKPSFVFQPRSFVIASSAILFAMMIFSSVTAVSNYFVYFAEREIDKNAAVKYYETALSVNSENSSAYFSRGIFFQTNKHYTESVKDLRTSIDMGLGTTITYTVLAESYTSAGNDIGAETTMAEAIEVYPYSSFAMARYVHLLENNGKIDEAEKHKKIGIRNNPSQFNGWYSIIKDGTLATFLKSREDTNVAQPSDLLPGSMVLTYLVKESQVSALLNE